LRKIISGGQTGADMGGLAAGRELGIETGGTAPRDWLTEDGPQEALLRSFDLTECKTAGYPARTRQNVMDSDGTLLVGPYRTGGSRLTRDIAVELNKPLFHLPYEENQARVQDFKKWLEDYRIAILNVAGNRESDSPGIAEFTHRFLVNAVFCRRGL
jgi:hypothetical protein